jgi:hypothetical protein
MDLRERIARLMRLSHNFPEGLVNLDIRYISPTI